jgi:hypothetical protein
MSPLLPAAVQCTTNWVDPGFRQIVHNELPLAKAFSNVRFLHPDVVLVRFCLGRVPVLTCAGHAVFLLKFGR